MSKAERISYSYIEQTCPKVNELERQCIDILIEDLKSFGIYDTSQEFLVIESRISTLVGKIKEQATEKLRESLINACDKIECLEADLYDKEREVSELESQLDNQKDETEYYANLSSDLQDQISNLESQLP